MEEINTANQRLRTVSAEFEQIIGEYRINVRYSLYFNEFMADYYVTHNLMYCKKEDDYMEGCYEYPFELLRHSTYPIDEDSLPSDLKEQAQKEIEAAYRELTMSPEEKTKRAERNRQRTRELLAKRKMNKNDTRKS